MNATVGGYPQFQQPQQEGNVVYQIGGNVGNAYPVQQFGGSFGGLTFVPQFGGIVGPSFGAPGFDGFGGFY